MDTKPWLLLALAAALVVIFYLMSPSQTPVAPTQTPVATATPSPTTSTTPTITPTETPKSTTTLQTPTKPTSETPRAATTTATPRPALRYVPKVEVEVLAPAVVSTTKLPAAVNYTVVLRNVGNATAVVNASGALVEVRPGEEVRLSYTAVANAAGKLKLAVEINGTEYAKEVSVYYSTPYLKFTLLNSTVVVDRLPVNITVYVLITNAGNATGYFNDVSIEPNATRVVPVVLTVTRAGSYEVMPNVGVSVVYLAKTYEARLLNSTIAVARLPANASVVFAIVATGNGTLTIIVNGTEIRLAPNSTTYYSAPIRINMPLTRNGTYMTISLSLNGSIRTFTLRVFLASPTFSISSVAGEAFIRYISVALSNCRFTELPIESLRLVFNVDVTDAYISGNGWVSERDIFVSLSGRLSKEGDVWKGEVTVSVGGYSLGPYSVEVSRGVVKISGGMCIPDAKVIPTALLDLPGGRYGVFDLAEKLLKAIGAEEYGLKYVGGSYILRTNTCYINITKAGAEARCPSREIHLTFKE